MVKSIDIPAFSAGGGVASKLILAAALAGAMTIGAPAMAEVEYIPNPTTIATNGAFTLGTPTAEPPETGGYIVLEAIDKATNPWTVGTAYSSYTPKTDWVYGDGTNPIAGITSRVPNSTDVTLNVAYQSSEARVGDMTSDIGSETGPATVFAELSDTYGGAIYNSGNGNYSITNTAFLKNSSDYGGSIMNWGGIMGNIINSTFISNCGIKTDSGGGAIYNHNGAQMGDIINSTFMNNRTGNDGAAGAIYNYNSSKIGNITNSTFISNSSGFGGAIYNYQGTIGNITNSTFISNSASKRGGVIYNYKGTIGNITNSTFINNSAATSAGGAIYNNKETIGNITNSTFINNSANGNGGGAIYNYQGTIGNITNSTFINNSANGNGGGAIFNNYGTIANITNSTFISNSTSNWGGAVYNAGGSITSIQDSIFISNHAGHAGAIGNWSSTLGEIKNSIFINNSADNEAGAIQLENNAATIGSITNSTFLNNSAGTRGGAIWAMNDLNITSDSGTTLFKGNTDSTGSNAIYVADAAKTVTFDHKNGGKTYMYDTVDGASGYTVDIKGDGTMYLFNDINNANVSIGGVEFNTINNDIHTYNFDTLNLTNDFNMAVDVDLANAKMDRLAAETVSGTGKINVVGMNIVKDSTKKSTSVFFADNNLKDKVVNNVTEVGSGADNPYQTTAYSPIFKYNVLYNQEETGGYYNFNTDGYNPSVLAAPAAAQAGAMAGQWNSYDQAFLNLDMNMLFTREARRAMKLQNKYASAETPKVFSETYLPEKDKGAWVRPYTSFETVHLRKGPHVNNTMYGMYLGGDSEMYELKHNWDFQYSVYAGYNGSRQSYSDVTILQNGGTLGATGIFYHGDFFTGLTVNVGAGVANADTMYGHEDFAMLMTGVGSKTGYNWELAKGRFIIQPSWLMSYSFVNTFDYTNAAGVKISSDPIHAIQLAPQLKFIGNLPKGWQPYASVQMVWNIMDESRFKANDVSLPTMSNGPFIQYGVGVQKRWGERFTGFFQTMFRNGSRTGVAFTLGFRWALGKDKPKTSSTTQRTVIK